MVEGDNDTLEPPPKSSIPWLLPRAEEVLRFFDEDDASLYDDLVAYFRAASELPTAEHYDLLATWVMHSYLLERAQYSPILCLYAVPERGKTRTGKAIVYVAYRGIHVESFRDPYIVRFAANFGGTIFFDVMNVWRKAEKQGSDDILLGRFERGFTVPRVLYPDRGPHRDTVYYKVFGPTVIGTNEAPHHILDTRAATITMPQARRTFEADVTPETARPFRERLVAFRARHLGRTFPDTEKPAPGRLGDILRPLLQVLRVVRPEREMAFRGLIRELQKERLTEKADSIESEILQAMCHLRNQVEGDVLAVKMVTETVNEGRPENRRITPQKVGKRLKSLGFEKGVRTAAGTTIQWDDDKLVRTMEAYGLGETAQTTHSAQVTGDGDGEYAECVESTEGVPGPGARTGFDPTEVVSWPEDWQEAYHERFAVLTVDGGLPDAEAHERAVDYVKRTSEDGNGPKFEREPLPKTGEGQ